MSVVVSDPTPLHCLILCNADAVLPRLFSHVLIPPIVFGELQLSTTPPRLREWARSLPSWAAVQAPSNLKTSLDVDPGELEAICLAREMNAFAVLMDDRTGRAAAIRSGVAVIGTMGLLELAASRNLLGFPETMERLRQTNARFDPELIRVALERNAARKPSRP